MDAPKRSLWRRFRPRISLRALLLVVALFGLLFAYLGMKWRSAKRQEAAVAALKPIGSGAWSFDYRVTRRSVPDSKAPKQATWVPEWLADYLGPHFFQSVRTISLGHPNNPANYPDWPKTRDDSMEILQVFPGLRELEMFSTDVTDRGIEQLVHCPELHNLTLRLNKHITPASMQSIKKLRRLHTFYCIGVLNSDEGLAHLKELPQLRELDLVDFRSEPGITDDGLRHVGEMKSLHCLVIHMSSITDKGLIHLRNLTELQVLYLSDTKVTPQGVKQLQLALPDCKITVR